MKRLSGCWGNAVDIYYLYRQSSGFPHHERKESDVFLLFLRNNAENHFLFAINICRIITCGRAAGGRWHFPEADAASKPACASVRTAPAC